MSGTAPTPAPLTPTTLQVFMLRLINDARSAAGTGLRLLVLDAELTAAAQNHAQYMVDADAFGHGGQGGSTPGQRGTLAGYQWTRYGENVAFMGGPDAGTLDENDVRQLHKNLMASAPHRANILSANFAHVGIGIVQGDYRGNPAVMVTQNFATPTAAELADGTGIADPAAPAPVPTTPPVTPTPEPVPTPVPTTPTPPAPSTPPVQTARVTVTAGDVTQHVDITLGGAVPVVTVVSGA